MASEAFSVVAHSCSPSNGEAETGGWQVLDYPGLHDNTPRFKKNLRNEWSESKQMQNIHQGQKKQIIQQIFIWQMQV
jgi:hypothetical protein